MKKPMYAVILGLTVATFLVFTSCDDAAGNLGNISIKNLSAEREIIEIRLYEHLSSSGNPASVPTYAIHKLHGVATCNDCGPWVTHSDIMPIKHNDTYIIEKVPNKRWWLEIILDKGSSETYPGSVIDGEYFVIGNGETVRLALSDVGEYTKFGKE